MNRIPNAIVIEGPGRSGTFLLYRILALHPDLGWVSGYVNRFPRYPFLSCLNRIQGWPRIEKLNRGKKKWPRPAEAYTFWKTYFPGFSPSLQASEIDEESVKRCIRTIRAILRYSGKKRFLTKTTGVQSPAVLEAVFDAPKIVYMDRDPRAVAMSFYKHRTRYRHRSDAFNSKSTRALIREYAERFMAIYERKKALTDLGFKQLCYEDLVNDPPGFFRGLLEYLGLGFSAGFRKILDSWNIRQGANEEWKRLLNRDEGAYLNKLLQLPITELGYE